MKTLRAPRGRDNAGVGREVSAGGVVRRGNSVLMVKVRNLKGEKLWTFPKGHVDPGETAREAALREVEEETGWRCRITRRALTARYSFRRDGRLIRKRVFWYWMTPLERVGELDAAEILAVRWAGLRRAEGLARYPADLELLRLSRRRSDGV